MNCLQNFHCSRRHELVAFIVGIPNFEKTALCSANLCKDNITLFNLQITFRSVSKEELLRDKYVLLKVNIMLKIIRIGGDMHRFPQGPLNLLQ